MFTHLLQYAYSLNYEDQPDYQFLKEQLFKILVQNIPTDKVRLDWSGKFVSVAKLNHGTEANFNSDKELMKSYFQQQCGTVDAI